MTKEELKDRLFEDLYWYYRLEYATVCDFIEKESQDIKIYNTKNSDRYAIDKITQLIERLEVINR